jgi:hypothetical protein
VNRKQVIKSPNGFSLKRSLWGNVQWTYNTATAHKSKVDLGSELLGRGSELLLCKAPILSVALFSYVLYSYRTFTYLHRLVNLTLHVSPQTSELNLAHIFTD